MSDNRKKEKINIRKYVNFVLLMAAIVLVAFIASKLYGTYKDNKLGESVFTRMVGTIQYDDIEDTTSEMPSEGFILISYTKDQDVKNLESALKKSVVEHELQSNFYYLDATDLKLEEGYLNALNSKFKLEGANTIRALPAIIYYQDGELMKTISSTENRMLSVDDFNKMLDNYEIVEK